jgi:hypothetical protein
MDSAAAVPICPPAFLSFPFNSYWLQEDVSGDEPGSAHGAGPGSCHFGT